MTQFLLFPAIPHALYRGSALLAPKRAEWRNDRCGAGPSCHGCKRMVPSDFKWCQRCLQLSHIQLIRCTAWLVSNLVQRIVEETIMVFVAASMLTIESWIRQKMGYQISSIHISTVFQGDHAGVYWAVEQTLLELLQSPSTA